MDDAVAWIAYLGAWLLVAGPMWQAAIELHEENLERERFEAIGKTMPQPHVSPWWWLLPPVAYMLQRRNSQRYRNAFLAQLSPGELESLMQYLNKAAGWLLVGLGGTCIGLKETWELRERYEWPDYRFWLLAALAALLCVGNVMLRIQRSRGALEDASLTDRPVGR